MIGATDERKQKTSQNANSCRLPELIRTDRHKLSSIEEKHQIDEAETRNHHRRDVNARAVQSGHRPHCGRGRSKAIWNTSSARNPIRTNANNRGRQRSAGALRNQRIRLGTRYRDA